eukprot:Nk52_evm4s211 gene=Nk52_evmTU4s211
MERGRSSAGTGAVDVGEIQGEERKSAASGSSCSSPKERFRAFKAGAVVPMPLVLRNVSYRVAISSGKRMIDYLPLVAPAAKNSFVIEETAGDTKYILKDIDFHAKPGQLVAILGSSGSGKTTMLDVIGMRTSTEGGDMFVDGEILIGGKKHTRDLVKRNVAYVMQDDALLPHLTVRETFMYVAQLRLPRDMQGQAQEQVERVIAELALRHVADVRVGNELVRGVSGGERRRVSVGVQLLMNPSVLLLDEPTSGLDSFSAQNVCQFLADLAHSSSRTIVMTIHQPRSQVFSMIDEVVLLTHGQCAYYGKANEMIDFFACQGYPCPEFTNPLDYYIDLIAINRKSEALFIKSRDRVKGLVDYYREHQSTLRDFDSELGELESKDVIPDKMKAENQNDKTEGEMNALTLEMNGIDSRSGVEDVVDANPSPKYVHRSGSSTFVVLTKRMMTNGLRDYAGIFSRITQTFFFGIIILLFMGRLGDDQVSVQNRVGFMYEVMGGTIFCGLLTEVSLFPADRDMFYRERRDGLYGPVTFMAGYSVYIFPFTFIATVLFSVLMFFSTNLLVSAENFFIFFFVSLASTMAGESIGHLTLSIFRIVSRGSDIGGLILSVMLVSSTGLLRSYDAMPKIVQWVAYAMPPKYHTQLLIVSQFEDLELECSPYEPCVYPNGQAYIDSVFPGAEGENLRNLLLTAMFICVLKILPVIVLKYRVRSIR